MLKIVPSNRFKKDLKLAVKRNLDLQKLNGVLIYLPGKNLCQPT